MRASYHRSMLVYCTTDLIFATRIRAAADDAGRVSRPARNAEMLQARLNCVDDGKPNDAVTRVIVDLAMEEDAIAMIAQAREHDAELSIVAFGSHVEVELFQQAREAGASESMPRSRFVEALGQLVQPLA